LIRSTLFSTWGADVNGNEKSEKMYNRLHIAPKGGMGGGCRLEGRMDDRYESSGNGGELLDARANPRRAEGASFEGDGKELLPDIPPFEKRKK